MEALLKIGVAQAQVGDVVAAQVAAQSIAHHWQHAEALREIAVAQAQIGDAKYSA